MRKMKDSGIEWIGKIPESWSVSKIKHHLRRNEPRNPGGCTVLSLYRELGIVPKDSRDDNHNVTSLDTSNYKYVKVGDFVINKMKAWQGSVAVSSYEGIVSPAYYVYNFLDNVFDKLYFHYLLRSCYKDEFRRLSGGIREGQWDLSSENFDNTLVLIPPLSEQQKISAYLDRQCGLIDSVIEKTKASIEEYKKLRQAVITQAVTKGVRGDRPMKDSGIEWIGEIPSEWKVCKFKHIICKKIDNRGRTPDLLDNNDGIPIVEVASLGKKHPDLSAVKKYISMESHDEYIRDDVETGDLLITTVGATIGKCSIVDVPNFCIAQNLVGYRVNSNNYPLFWYYYFQSFVFQDMFALYDKGNTINNVKISNMEQGSIVVATYDEQFQIAAYLDKKCTEIDSLITKKEQFLNELEAYKKSLIYEYVTGKKEVPQA